MEKTFRIQKTNLAKLVPILIDRNIDFSVRCTGTIPTFSSDDVIIGDKILGDTFIAITLDMSGTQFHNLLVDTVGRDNLVGGAKKW